MLRASIESEGGEDDLRSLTDGAAAADSTVPGAAVLIPLVEATLAGEPTEIAKARDRVRDDLGSAALVDAAAVIGNFERMVRIADSTGIPLDTPVNVATSAIRGELGIDGFEAAARTKPARAWQRALGRVIDPIAMTALRWRAKRGASTSD